MCRRNKMWGLILIAFGLGLMIGQSLEMGFWCISGSVVIIFAGFTVMRQR